MTADDDCRRATLTALADLSNHSSLASTVRTALVSEWYDSSSERRERLSTGAVITVPALNSVPLMLARLTRDWDVHLAQARELLLDTQGGAAGSTSMQVMRGLLAAAFHGVDEGTVATPDLTHDAAGLIETVLAGLRRAKGTDAAKEGDVLDGLAKEGLALLTRVQRQSSGSGLCAVLQQTMARVALAVLRDPRCGLVGALGAIVSE